MNKKFYVNATFNTDTTEKKAGSNTLKIAGYANTVDKDRAGDVVLASAWAKGVDRFRKNPVLLYQHKHDTPIGRVNKVTVDKKGMFIEAAVSEAAEKLHGIHSLIKDGALKSFSVGFLVKDGKHDKTTDTFVISDVELLEVSVVSVPANQESLFSVRKNFENDEEYENFKNSFASEPKEEPVETEDAIEDPYKPIPFLNLLSQDTSKLSKAQYVQLEDNRYVITKIATSDSPTFEFKQVDLQGQHLDKILNIDASCLEVLNISELESKFDIKLLQIQHNTLDDTTKNNIKTTFNNLVNLTEKQLYDLKKETTDQTLQEKLNRTINLVSTKDWTDSDYQIADRVCQIINKLKDIEQSEANTLLKLHGHLKAQTKEKLNMATQAVDEPVVIGSTAETTSEVTASVKVAEPRVAELVEKTGEAIIKEADAKDKHGEYTPRESEKAAELQAQIKKYKEEIAALQNSKMVFQEQSRATQFSGREIANAYLLAKALRKETPFETKLGARMKSSVTTVDQFLSNFSSDLYTELQQELVVAKMLRRMSVDAKTFRVPVADEDTDGDVAQFASGTYTTGISDATNVPTSNRNTIKSVDFTPHKFMATTHLAKDEEEDTILPLLDFLRTASMRRMGRAIDKALLRGDGTLNGFTASPTNAVALAGGYASVFKGIATLANDISGLRVQTGTSNTTKATPTNIASARAVLGKYGLQLGDHLVYLTTIEGYNELVSNSDFRTVDKFGPNATYLTGALGAVYGIPVMITEFLDVVASGTANTLLGLLVYKPGFVMAERRAMEIESEYDPRRQVTAIYMSTRLDLKALTTNASAALDATKYPMASVIRAGV